MTHIARWTATWLRLNPAPKKADAPAANPERMFSLARMLQVQVLRPAGGEVKLFTQEMNNRCLLFKSATTLAVGEVLTTHATPARSPYAPARNGAVDARRSARVLGPDRFQADSSPRSRVAQLSRASQPLRGSEKLQAKSQSCIKSG